MATRAFSTAPAVINVMADAAFKAARGLLRDFSEIEKLQVSCKGPGDFVSAADRRSEEVIYGVLNDAYPDYNFLMEEAGSIISSGDISAPTWIVDPLDGTKNFLHGLPHFSIAIALKEQGRYTAAIVYDPIRDELFWAQKEGGAFMNDTRIRVSDRKHISEALISIGGPGIGANESMRTKTIGLMQKVSGRVSGVRTLGSAALDLAYISSGRFDGFCESKAIEWDVAAGILLIKEAGGFVTDFSGSDKILAKSEIVAGNETMHKELLKLINE